MNIKSFTQLAGSVATIVALLFMSACKEYNSPGVSVTPTPAPTVEKAKVTEFLTTLQAWSAQSKRVEIAADSRSAAGEVQDLRWTLQSDALGNVTEATMTVQRPNGERGQFVVTIHRPWIGAKKVAVSKGMSDEEARGIAVFCNPMVAEADMMAILVKEGKGKKAEEKKVAVQ